MLFFRGGGGACACAACTHPIRAWPDPRAEAAAAWVVSQHSAATRHLPSSAQLPGSRHRLALRWRPTHPPLSIAACSWPTHDEDCHPADERGASSSSTTTSLQNGSQRQPAAASRGAAPQQQQPHHQHHHHQQPPQQPYVPKPPSPVLQPPTPRPGSPQLPVQVVLPGGAGRPGGVALEQYVSSEQSGNAGGASRASAGTPAQAAAAAAAAADASMDEVLRLHHLPAPGAAAAAAMRSNVVPSATGAPAGAVTWEAEKQRL